MRQRSKSTTSRPDYRVTYKAGDDDFREIGAAWHRKDGNGLFLRLNGMPEGHRVQGVALKPAACLVVQTWNQFGLRLVQSLQQ